MYVIAYDIADEKRLRRVARLMERHATRVQKSVFLFHGDEAGVNALLDEAAGRMDLEADVVQAWKAARVGPGAWRGALANLNPPAVVLGDGQEWLMPDERRDEA